MTATSLFPEQVEVFFDGDCPLCKREMGLMQRLDRRHQIRFTDIAAPEFQADSYGLTFDDFMAEIRGRLPDGTMIKGVEVFRRLYTALGWRWLSSLSRLPVVSHGLDFGYRIFARNRLRLTGRCAGGACELPTHAAKSAAHTPS
ncbi:MAG: thiol-disulfide oxidoreductase DCC family protein [Planctomycetaceae bacterium]